MILEDDTANLHELAISHSSITHPRSPEFSERSGRLSWKQKYDLSNQKRAHVQMYFSWFRNNLARFSVLLSYYYPSLTSRELHAKSYCVFLPAIQNLIYLEHGLRSETCSQLPLLRLAQTGNGCTKLPISMKHLLMGVLGGNSNVLTVLLGQIDAESSTIRHLTNWSGPSINTC